MRSVGPRRRPPVDSPRPCEKEVRQAISAQSQYCMDPRPWRMRDRDAAESALYAAIQAAKAEAYALGWNHAFGQDPTDNPYTPEQTDE